MKWRVRCANCRYVFDIVGTLLPSDRCPKCGSNALEPIEFCKDR